MMKYLKLFSNHAAGSEEGFLQKLQNLCCGKKGSMEALTGISLFP